MDKISKYHESDSIDYEFSHTLNLYKGIKKKGKNLNENHSKNKRNIELLISQLEKLKSDIQNNAIQTDSIQGFIDFETKNIQVFKKNILKKYKFQNFKKLIQNPIQKMRGSTSGRFRFALAAGDFFQFWILRKSIIFFFFVSKGIDLWSIDLRSPRRISSILGRRKNSFQIQTARGSTSGRLICARPNAFL